ncbi:hypothetical protein [uncultured Psychroserpens sp.]|uniref:hypothetical protein n=1 Tax=uncultured Psychroserpens sp. TaxID=255436 RepID=UPI002619B260|nr:hypothetical protein [uncultured Psychroserpens sp.]
MMNKLIYFLILIIISVFNSFGQKNNCKKRIKDYSNFIHTDDSTQWLLTLSKNNETVLFYYGAFHSNNSLHNQFIEIEKAWNSEKFDIALYEGPDRSFLSTKNETIEKLGESGFLRFLASKDSIKTQSLEPSPVAEIEYLLNYFSTEKIKLFFLLREAQRVRENFNWGEKEIKARIEKLLIKANSIPKLKHTILTIEDLDSAFIKYWGKEKQWWEAPSNWFDPLSDSKRTGGIFTNDINKRSSYYRDIHMYQLISKLLGDNKKVFAVVGRNHVPMQAEAIKCECKKYYD